MQYTGAIQVEVTDVNEPPSNVRMIDIIGGKIPENATVGTYVGELLADNPEGFRQHLTFEVLNWQDTFTVKEGHAPGKVSYLTIKKELDYAFMNSYNLTIEVTDNGVPPLSALGIVVINIQPTDPCASGSLDCGTEICQRINKTHGNCGCLDGYIPKDGACVQVNDCKANCLYCEDSKKACQTEQQCLPCDNNGTCTDLLKSYKCTCLPGFTDERCKTNIDNCAPKPCLHGTCFDLVNSYRCECDEGYDGQNCSNNINECTRKECVKGDCTDLINGFSCSCLEGVWGLLCNRRKSDCPANRCGSDVCVPPAYKDAASLDKGDLQALCANIDNVIALTFPSSSVPDKQDRLAKWKYLFRLFITRLIAIPYYAVDLSEDKSNGGFYAPTDVVFYPFKSSKTRRDTTSSAESLILTLVVKVQARLVPQDSFLRAANKTCARIKETSVYWVFCSSAYARISDLGITAGTGKSTKDDSSNGGFKILKGNNIYILIGGCVGLLFIIAITVIPIARRKNAKRNQRLTNYISDLSESDGADYDAMERRHAEGLGDGMGAVNPIYGENSEEVEQHAKMFSNPAFGLRDSDHYDNELEQDGMDNPMYDAACVHGEIAADILPAADSGDFDDETDPKNSEIGGNWSFKIGPKGKNDSDC